MNESTIEVLPNEILGQIFELCVDEDIDMPSCLADSYQSYDYPSATLDTTRSPWALSHVSDRWRSLTLSSPGLWTAFDINWSTDDFEKRHLPYIEALLALQLERCGNQPLSISWYQKSCPKSVLFLLCSKAQQWTNVTLRIGRIRFDWLFEFRDQFPNITNLHLCFQTHGVAWDLVSQLQEEYGYFYGMFKNTPNLRRLTLSGDYEVMPHVVSEIPWKQLTHFTGKHIITDGGIEESFFGVLPLLENVETCRLDIPAEMNEMPSGSFTLPRLHTLTVNQGSGDVGYLTDVLKAPSLRSLHLIDGPLFDSSLPLLHLINRSSCHITYLSFHDELRELDKLDALQFIEYLRAEQLESVKTLRITSPTLAIPAVLDAFHFPEPQAVTLTSDDKVRLVLPHLQALVVTDVDKGSKLDSSKLVDMLASRRAVSATVSPLESLTICGEVDSFQFKDPEAMARFEQLQRDGLVYSRIVYQG